MYPPAKNGEPRSREGAPRRCARPRHTALLTCSRTRERHPHGTLSARRRNRHARTPLHGVAHHISLHNTTQQRTADFKHSNSQPRTPTTRCTQAHDSSRTHARTPGRRQLHRSSSSSGSQQTSHSREHAACSTTIITVISTVHACSTQLWLSSAFIGARIADRYTSGFIRASAAAHLSQQRSNGSNTVHASSNARYTLATHTPTRTRRHTATLHATCLVAHRRSVPFRGIEPQTIAKTRKDTQRPANMCQRYAKTRKDMQSECAKLSHEHANIISILL